MVVKPTIILLSNINTSVSSANGNHNLHSDTNGSRWKKDMGWHDTHNKDDPIQHSSTEDLVDSTLVSPSMQSIYPRID